ncbi:MAG TPA: HutD family protein [Rhodanobacter sp.]|nr:HutD family protein [Rhodanobacter sp.]
MIIRLADCPWQPWKNGLGRTRQIAVHPEGSNNGDFAWRVSMAEVDSAAPFSCFPGIDRTIVLLDGAGFTMTLDGERTHALTTPWVPFDFPGESAVKVALAGGSTRDFNLMVRREHARGRVQVWHEAGEYPLGQHTALIHCASGRITLGRTTLDAGDSWLNHHGTRVRLHAGTTALVVHIEPR